VTHNRGEQELRAVPVLDVRRMDYDAQYEAERIYEQVTEL
jgi:hypothetical protein